MKNVKKQKVSPELLLVGLHFIVAKGTAIIAVHTSKASCKITYIKNYQSWIHVTVMTTIFISILSLFLIKRNRRRLVEILIHNSIESMTQKINDEEKLKKEGENRGIMTSRKKSNCWKCSGYLLKNNSSFACVVWDGYVLSVTWFISIKVNYIWIRNFSSQGIIEKKYGCIGFWQSQKRLQLGIWGSCKPPGGGPGRCSS